MREDKEPPILTVNGEVEIHIVEPSGLPGGFSSSFERSAIINFY